MKFVIFLNVLIVLGTTFGSSEINPLLVQDQFRREIKEYFVHVVGRNWNRECALELSPEQDAFGNQKFDDFVSCGNATIDKFVDSLNFDAQLADIENRKTLQRYIGPMCNVFDDFFECVRGVEPLLDLCIRNSDRPYKNRLFKIVPLVQRTVCLKNGGLLADLFEHPDGLRCIEHTFNGTGPSYFDEIFIDADVEEIFGSTELCRKFNNFRLEVYQKVGECSPSILDNIVKEMIGYLCEGSQCKRFITDLECF